MGANTEQNGEMTREGDVGRNDVGQNDVGQNEVGQINDASNCFPSSSELGGGGLVAAAALTVHHRADVQRCR